MLSNAFEASPRLRSLPMSAPQPPGSAPGVGLGPVLPSPPMAVPSGSIAVGAAPSVVPVVGSGVLKNGPGMLGMEEEV